MTDLAKRVNTEVVLTGEAQNAFSGAILLLENRSPIYIAGLDEWPPDLYGKTLEVKGILRDKKLAPDPVVDADGAVSHGKLGRDWVIDGAQWRLIEETPQS